MYEKGIDREGDMLKSTNMHRYVRKKMVVTQTEVVAVRAAAPRTSDEVARAPH